VPIDELKRYHFVTGTMVFFNYTCFRSGYTGEDGFEMIVPAGVAPHLGMFLGSDESGIKPAGLGARDTLRLEAGMPLYGHELTEEVDPISAGQGWCVDLNKDFIGADALRCVKEAGPTRRIVGLTLAGKRIARQHAPVYQGEREIGEVTSGTLSPTLGRSIAMAYVDASLAKPGTTVSVGVGSARVEAEIIKMPFYKRISG
jgi:aminomethyltransferase